MSVWEMEEKKGREEEDRRAIFNHLAPQFGGWLAQTSAESDSRRRSAAHFIWGGLSQIVNVL